METAVLQQSWPGNTVIPVPPESADGNSGYGQCTQGSSAEYIWRRDISVTLPADESKLLATASARALRLSLEKDD